MEKNDNQKLLERLVYALKHDVNYYSQFNNADRLIEEDYQKLDFALKDYEVLQELFRFVSENRFELWKKLKKAQRVLDILGNKTNSFFVFNISNNVQEYNSKCDRHLVERDFKSVKEWINGKQ